MYNSASNGCLGQCRGLCQVADLEAEVHCAEQAMCCHNRGCLLGIVVAKTSVAMPVTSCCTLEKTFRMMRWRADCVLYV